MPLKGISGKKGIWIIRMKIMLEMISEMFIQDVDDQLSPRFPIL